MWSQNNNLLINTEKTSAILFHFYTFRPVIRPHIVLNNSEIAYKYISKLRFLGINITENLKRNVHIRSLCLNLHKASYIIKTLRHVLMPFVLRHIYFAEFQSLLSYGIISWGGESESIKVCRMQRKGTLNS
jgi:hypothetical protein